VSDGLLGERHRVAAVFARDDLDLDLASGHSPVSRADDVEDLVIVARREIDPAPQPLGRSDER
jgi:hypothetical protein